MPGSVDLLPPETLEEAAESLKALSHPVRLRMVDILTQGKFPVFKIAEMCDVQPHQASQHLRLLEGHGLLTSDRQGRAVYYRIQDDRLPELIECIRKARAPGT
jgi:ArsR family transcriptional regulator